MLIPKVFAILIRLTLFILNTFVSQKNSIFKNEVIKWIFEINKLALCEVTFFFASGLKKSLFWFQVTQFDYHFFSQ